jgi:hypothetical protein
LLAFCLNTQAGSGGSGGDVVADSGPYSVRIIYAYISLLTSEAEGDFR